MRHTEILRPIFVYRAFVLALCATMPVLAPLVGEPYWMDIFLRIMIWAIAAVSLDLILGFGGMVSFGHAMFIGLGGYTVGILAYYEIFNGFVQWPLALIISGTWISGSSTNRQWVQRPPAPRTSP